MGHQSVRFSQGSPLCSKSRNLGIFNALCFGAMGNGVDLDTSHIQSALDAAYRSGGGIVSLSPNECSYGLLDRFWSSCVGQTVYKSGSIFVRSNVVLRVEKGVTLRGSTTKDQFPQIYTRSEGKMIFKFASLVNIGRCNEMHISERAETVGGQRDSKSTTKKHDDMCSFWERNQNVTVEGGGTIDGAGEAWWTEKGPLRPTLLGAIYVNGLVIRNINLVNSAFWTIHPLFSDHVLVTEVNISAPADSPNTDGIDPDSSTNVYIARSRISVGDDCIAIKSGRDAAARRIGRPTSNVAIEEMEFGVCHGLSIGSEMSGGIRNITFRNSFFSQPMPNFPIIRIKTRQGRGSYIRDVHFSNITATSVAYVMRVNMFYPPQPARGNLPVISNVYIQDIFVDRAFGVGLFECLEDSPCRNFNLRNIKVLHSKNTYALGNIYGQSLDCYPSLELPPMTSDMNQQLLIDLKNANAKV
eukprot:CFRG1304T1